MKTKNISRLLLTGVILNSLNLNSFASILSEDGRYETFEGNNITIDNILEEDKVDVEIQGNTMVNVANQKDEVPITKSYTVEGTNHIPLQGEYDGKARPVIEGNTMYYNNDTGEVLDTFVEGANLSLVSSFEDQLVTQEMVDRGQEKVENLGKYKVEYRITGKNKVDSNKLEYGMIMSANGNFSSDSIGYYSDKTFYELKHNTNYSTTNIDAIFFYDKELKYIGFLDANQSSNKIFKIPNNCKYIRYRIGEAYYNDYIQLEEGSVATEYEPYKKSIKTFYLNSPLLEGDTIEDIDGKATHVKRYEKIILDGSSLYRAVGNSGLGIYRWGLGTKTVYPNIALVKDNEIGCYSDRYASVTPTDTWTGKKDGISLNSSGNEILLLYLDKYSDGSNESKTALINELKANPVTIVYKLATPVYETISEESILCDSYKDGHLDLNSNIPINKVDFMPTTTNLNYLYPSTEYTVQFESDNKGKVDKVSLGDEGLYSNYTVNQGINRFNITTPSEILSTELILDGIGFNLSNLIVTQSTDEDFDYFEGIKSVGQDDANGHKIEVISNNKNLFDGELVHGYWYQASFCENENAIANLNNIPVQPNTDYTFFIEGYNEWIYIAEMDKNYNEVKSFRIKSNEYITTTSSAKYLRFCTDMNYALPLDINVQIQKGSSATNYIEQQSNKIEISLKEPLRRLPNGVKDKIVKRNGQWMVERNVASYTIDVNEPRISIDNNSPIEGVSKFVVGNNIAKSNSIVCDTILNDPKAPYTIRFGGGSPQNPQYAIYLNMPDTCTVEDVRNFLKEREPTILYQPFDITYEPINIKPILNTYLDITHISNSSNIPANMKVVIDRTINKATEAIELAKTNPTVANISQARMWSNLLKETINKDALQDEINSITNIEDLQLERKTTTSNVDVYIKSENMLLMSLSTNSITFNDYSGVEDMELNNAINISINSSLPYQLNSYLLSEIENSDKSNRIEKDLLNIKANKDLDYKTFNDINEKLILEDSCDAGNNKSHSIDLRLKGSQAHKADIYKTVIKFEAEQK